MGALAPPPSCASRRARAFRARPAASATAHPARPRCRPAPRRRRGHRLARQPLEPSINETRATGTPSDLLGAQLPAFIHVHMCRGRAGGACVVRRHYLYQYNANNLTHSRSLSRIQNTHNNNHTYRHGSCPHRHTYYTQVHGMHAPVHPKKNHQTNHPPLLTNC
eukprot:scaffold16646_cov129-Isochrysis_galbana.AAC.2